MMRCIAIISALLMVAGPSASIAETANELIGTRTLVSAVTEKDGIKSDIFDPNGKGILVFDAHGRYSIVFVARDLPKFVSDNRALGTADENKAVILGSIAHFGTYVVDDARKIFTFQVERSTFPNMDGKNLERPFTIYEDVLRYTAPKASAGGFATVTFKRGR
jgi:hypothetical protein